MHDVTFLKTFIAYIVVWRTKYYHLKTFISDFT